MKRVRPEDRYKWILDYLRNGDSDVKAGVDVYNTEFVEAYINATGPRWAPQFYGAPICPQLGRDLSHMKLKRAMLVRKRVGVTGVAGMGFARWVWSYQLNPRLEVLLPRPDDSDIYEKVS